MAIRVSKARKRRQWRGFLSSALPQALQWLSLMSVLVRVVQDVLSPRSSRVSDGVPIQCSLRDAFLDIWETAVRAVGDFEGVLRLEVRCLTLC
jgi:hypothetical protein